MLDIIAFSNALLDGSVSCLRSLNAFVTTDRTGGVRVLAGDDAAVFPLERDGKPGLALRVPLDPDHAQRWPESYAELAMASGSVRRFLPDNLTLLDSDVPGEPPLVLVYDWVPGETLTETLRFTTSATRLDAVVESLVDLADTLPATGYVHGDLAPGNIIVRPDTGIVLVDLDRMAPAGANVHPRRRPGYRLADTKATAEAEDAFALLVMITSVAIVAGSEERSYQVESERGPHAPLVFSSWDLLDPDRSELVSQLDAVLSGLPALLLEHLVGACQAPADHVPHILAEAVHDVRRAPRSSRDQPRTVSQPTTWPGRQEQVSPSPAGSTDAWDDDPWSPASFNADVDGMTERVEPSISVDPAAVEQVLERLSALAATPKVTRRSNRHRQWLEGRRERVTSELRLALATNDRDVLVRLAMSGDIAELGDSDRADLVQVLRALSYDQIARAVASDLDDAIVAAVDPEIFESDGDIDAEFRPRVQLARERLAWIEQVIAAVQQGEPDRCVELLTVTPPEGLERLPIGIRHRMERMAAIASAAIDVRHGIEKRNIGEIVGAMARLSAQTGNWGLHVDADQVVATVGYPRIRKRLADLVANGQVSLEDQWLVDCVMTMGEIEDVAHLAGVSSVEMEKAISSA